MGHAANRSFNAITIDGDTSTTTRSLVATGQAGNPLIVGEGTAEFGKLSEIVTEVAQILAQAIVRDGEGATKFITINVEGGSTARECLRVGTVHRPFAAREDGVLRVRPEPAAHPRAIGNAGIDDLDPSRVGLVLGAVTVVENGGRAVSYTEEQGKRV